MFADGFRRFSNVKLSTIRVVTNGVIVSPSKATNIQNRFDTIQITYRFKI